MLERGRRGAIPASALASVESAPAAIVKDVYLFDPAAAHRLSRLDEASGTLQPADWPASLRRAPTAGRRPASGRRQVPRAGRGSRRRRRSGARGSLPAYPALPPWRTDRDPAGSPRRYAGSDRRARFGTAAATADRAARRQVFGAAASSDYYVTIVRRDDPRRVVYASAPKAIADAGRRRHRRHVRCADEPGTRPSAARAALTARKRTRADRRRLRSMRSRS